MGETSHGRKDRRAQTPTKVSGQAVDTGIGQKRGVLQNEPNFFDMKSRSHLVMRKQVTKFTNGSNGAIMAQKRTQFRANEANLDRKKWGNEAK
jgi:hypothetical protein